MEQFQNVTIVKKANIYFDGKVINRTVLFEDDTRKTPGIMPPGQYEFGTGDSELMGTLAGVVGVFLPGRTEWQTTEAGRSLKVPANSKFQIEMQEPVDYCCPHGKE